MGNSILRKNGWSVSFNPDTEVSAQLSSIGFLNDFPMEQYQNGGVSNIETALLIDEEFYILNGDWRSNYEKLESKEDAVAFFKSKENEYGSAWSTK